MLLKMLSEADKRHFLDLADLLIIGAVTKRIRQSVR